ncbi:MAG: PhoPQ-activated protein PqaA family protein [FCB group bacterium]|jgi:PhoPQ-activated pathogenicity-related protein|nr:PhoPQ-activated protein PqaA family protein [FCB group bacterium]
MSRVLVFRVWVLFALGTACLLGAPVAQATPLDDYCAEPDPNYSWQHVATYAGSLFTDHVIQMTSQKWDPADWDSTSGINEPIWNHWMILTVPKGARHDTALMVVSGSSINRPAPTGSDSLAQFLAVNTGSVVVTLKQIPSEPMTFLGYRQETEDGLIAYGWRKFLEGGDARWLMRLPMTKACLRAMDTVTEFMASDAGGGMTVDKFVVAGASKRGWTTWTTGVVDAALPNPRVVGIIPMVIDLLNMEPSLSHHFDAYGFWSPAIWDYTENRIMEWLNTPQMGELCSIVEPYAYLDRLTMPKLVIAGSGDEFFLPDSAQFYFHRLKGEKTMLYASNAGHSLEGSDGDVRPEILAGLVSWYSSFLTNQTRPQISWYKRHDGSLVIDTQGNTPLQAVQWTATNPTMRVFIHEVFGDLYQPSVLQPVSPGHYIASAPAPSQGWTAFYALFSFDSGNVNAPFMATTEISVVPDVLPYGPQPQLGSATALLEDTFYTDGGMSLTPVRYAVQPSPSHKGRYTAFWGVHSQSQMAGLFIVTAGHPSSWQRLTPDQFAAPLLPIVWSPDDTALLVGQSRLILPAAGQQSSFQPITLHGLALNVLDTTGMASDNVAAGKLNGEVVLLPILPGGGEDLSRTPVVVTDLASTGIQIQSVSISANGSTLAFDDVREGAVRDTGDVYTVRNLDTIRNAGKKTGTLVSTLAPAALDDLNVCEIRGKESDNYACRPSLSDDGTWVYYTEDWSNTYRAANPIASLATTNFDVMVAYASGLEADTRLGVTGSQAFAAFTEGGTRAIYAQPVNGVPRLFAAPIRVNTLSTDAVSPFWVKSMYVTSMQHFESDGSALLVLPIGVDVSFPTTSQTISVETPVAPESYSRIPASVGDLPFVRTFAPEAATMVGYAKLVLKYSDAEMAGLNEDLLKVYRLDRTANVYKPVTSPSIVHDKAANTITIEVDRLGTYGIGGPESAPGSVDDDRDGMSNRWEAFYGMDPYNGSDMDDDTDGDGLTALEEFQYGSAPNMEDTDGDGYWDNVERRAGSNPADVTDMPPAPVGCDLDYSGRVDAVDIQIVINLKLGMRAPSHGDANGDGVVDAKDIQLVINAALGAPTENPDPPEYKHRL